MMERNKPCWCLSGLKYKKCHLGREKLSPCTRNDIFKINSKLRSKKTCMHPRRDECSTSYSLSHSLQRAKSLKKIANTAFRVYEIAPRHAPFEHAKHNTPTPILVHISKASTFYGFCTHHDNELFSEIENNDFDIRSNRHAFMTAYRCLCYEIKLRELGIQTQEITRHMLDRGISYTDQVNIQTFILGYIERAKLDLASMKQQKKMYDDMIIKDNYDDIRWLAISFDRIPDIMCTGHTALAYDFSGDFLQREHLESIHVNTKTRPAIITRYPMFLHTPLHYFSFSIFSTENSNIALFAWHKSSDIIYHHAAKTLTSVNKNKISDALLALSLIKFENVYMNPNFWDNLTLTKRKRLTDIMDYNALKNCIKGIDKFIQPEDERITDWEPRDTFLTNSDNA